VIIEPDRERATQRAKDTILSDTIIVATSSSVKGGKVGAGGAIREARAESFPDWDRVITYKLQLGTRDGFNVYIAELTAISMALEQLANICRNRSITILSSTLSALQAIKRPKHQSGQQILSQIYKHTHKLRKEGNQIRAIWAPSHENTPLKLRAKESAKAGTEENCLAHLQPGAKTTILSKALQDIQRHKIPDRIGKFTTDLDRALPGKHVKRIYDNLKRPEASILAQLRIGMARVNEYLHRIGAADTDKCSCGQATESIKHFLFRCTKWDE
jgi:ribonuclease HI